MTSPHEDPLGMDWAGEDPGDYEPERLPGKWEHESLLSWLWWTWVGPILLLALVGLGVFLLYDLFHMVRP